MDATSCEVLSYFGNLIIAYCIQVVGECPDFIDRKDMTGSKNSKNRPTKSKNGKGRPKPDAFEKGAYVTYLTKPKHT